MAQNLMIKRKNSILVPQQRVLTNHLIHPKDQLLTKNEEEFLVKIIQNYNKKNNNRG